MKSILEAIDNTVWAVYHRTGKWPKNITFGYDVYQLFCNELNTDLPQIWTPISYQGAKINLNEDFPRLLFAVQ